MTITEILKAYGAIGRENGMNLRKIAQITGKNIRVIVKMVQDERKATPEEKVGTDYICSDTVHGYYLPSCIDDIVRTEKSLSRAARTRFYISQSIRRYIRRMRGTVKPASAAGKKKHRITEKPISRRP